MYTVFKTTFLNGSLYFIFCRNEKEWAGVVPLRVVDATMVVDAKELVNVCDLVHVRALSVYEVGVWLPKKVQHFDARPQNVDLVRHVESEARIVPFLPEVAVH